jgi:hypothetical protein
MYNWAGALMALQRLEQRPNIPFDHAFYLAGLEGAFAAVALPNLFVVDHRVKTSTVNDGRAMDGREEMEYRAERNRCNLSNYNFAHTRGEKEGLFYTTRIGTIHATRNTLRFFA